MRKPTLLKTASIFLLSAMLSATAFATDKKNSDTSGNGKQVQPGDIGNGNPNGDQTGAERVNVENIKEKYWARGDESELGVVQNRQYSKAHRLELGLLGGFNSTDPLLSVKMLGLTLGFHFSEYISFHLLAWRYLSGSSLDNAGTQALVSQASPALNSNKPQDYFGGELRWSLLYGKLSLLGKAIIYYDLHLDGGLGETLYNAPTPEGQTTGGQPIAPSSNSGQSFSESIGIGQQFYLNKHMTLNVDYRMIHYTETLVQTVISSEYGAQIGSRDNYSHTIAIGVSFLIGK